MKRNDDESRFPGKVTHCRRVFFFFYPNRSVARWGERHKNGQSCQRQRKNPQQKWKNWIRGACECFCIKAGNLVFNLINEKFCFDGDFFVRHLNASVEQSISRFIKYAENMKMSACHENTPRGLTQVRDCHTIQIYWNLKIRSSKWLARNKGFCFFVKLKCDSNLVSIYWWEVTLI